ncbi:BCCT family transporter [Shewanella sp.]|uniref:BCCT family transporter n=1 Tax=Shewanella sp. TaxID=50422 RepID=UPI00258DFF32|nr:BCCT family transporter [Shewanella sp.]MCJ8301175.1 BCCT family transporter [Shewanella sp.]
MLDIFKFKKTKQNSPIIDWLSVSASSLFIFIVIFAILFKPELVNSITLKLMDVLLLKFGSIYLILGIAVTIFILWLAFGKHGNLVLGDSSKDIEFSTFSWASMIFCAGIGSSLFYWASIEVIYHYMSPPFGLEPHSQAAASTGMEYTLYFWGIPGWSIYTLCAIPLAYSFHVMKRPYLTISSACHSIIGPDEKSWKARAINIIFSVSLVLASGASISLSVPLISKIFSEIFNITNDFSLNVVVILITTIIFSISLMLGLKNGIRRLSNFNSILLISFLLFIFLVGPTAFILNFGIESLGSMFSNYIKMSTWTASFGESDFPYKWTAFYLAWWFVYSPFVAIFISKISKGRTIKQVLISGTLIGSISSWLCIIILGGYNINLNIFNIVDTVSVLQLTDASTAITTAYEQLPGYKTVLMVIAFICIISQATTFDSVSYVLALSSCKEIKEGQEPSNIHKFSFSLLISIIPLGFVFIGGLNILQTALVLASVPIVLIYMLMLASFMLDINKRSDSLSKNIDLNEKYEED